MLAMYAAHPPARRTWAGIVRVLDFPELRLRAARTFFRLRFAIFFPLALIMYVFTDPSSWTNRS